jgi:SAM-dependent methyltransferase
VPAAADLDRFALYELCVQDAPLMAGLLAALHGGGPRVLGEDFCGTAALSREWVRRVSGGRAIAVDHDPEALARAGRSRSITLVRGDVMGATRPARAHRVDVLHAGNFSIGFWHERSRLLAYLRHARARLNPGGVFVCDLYGGERSFSAGTERVHHALPGGGRVTYTWEQREADPCTGRVVNAIHFEVQGRARARARLIRDAFVYDWRLWGLAELRDALADAGFTCSEVYAKVPDAVDGEGTVHARLLRGAQDLDDSYDVLIMARRQ